MAKRQQIRICVWYFFSIRTFEHPYFARRAGHNGKECWVREWMFMLMVMVVFIRLL